MKRGCLGCLCLGLLLFVLLLILAPGAKEVDLTATGFAWERTASIDALVTETEEAWQDAVPEAARILDLHQEQRTVNRVKIGSETRTRTVTEKVQVGTEKVKVGVRDLGNGYFEDLYEERPVYENVERQEEYEEPMYRGDPVFDIRVRYEIDRWKPRREIRHEGQGQPAGWREPDLAPDEWLRQVKGKYTAYFRGPKGKTFQWETHDENAWRELQEGTVYRAKAYVNSGRVTKIHGPRGRIPLGED